MVKINKTYKKVRKTKNNKTKRFSKKELNSNDGMLTTVWGPSLWHYLHIMSFNFPSKPTILQKNKHLEFIKNLQYTMPCKYCRINLKKNFKVLPPTKKIVQSRESFSRYIYNLHELINTMLDKKSSLSYDDVRQRYEHFRARCTKKNINDKTFKLKNLNKSIKKENGCTTPYYGKKSKCIIKIVPQENKCNTFQMDNKCLRRKENKKTKKSKKNKK
tara:strand:- start:1017 stop:1664 length:648 start_codon:yes stop_codon:yes gene_type:complete